MDYFIPIACTALLGGLVLYVGYPLFAARRQTQRAPTSTLPAKDLLERKEQLYASIKEIEFDLSTGKLAEEDYLLLRAELERDALHVLQEVDQLNGQVDSTVLQNQIEADIHKLRQTATTALSLCPSCKAQRQPEDRFCSQCGAHLAETS